MRICGIGTSSLAMVLSIISNCWGLSVIIKLLVRISSITLPSEERESLSTASKPPVPILPPPKEGLAADEAELPVNEDELDDEEEVIADETDAVEIVEFNGDEETVAYLS